MQTDRCVLIETRLDETLARHGYIIHRLLFSLNKHNQVKHCKQFITNKLLMVTKTDTIIQQLSPINIIRVFMFIAAK